jgi:[amino group carrier protein]-lysine/ornithine hydrolase
MTGVAVEPVKLLLDSLKIYSPTTREDAYANFLADRMEKMGYSRVRIDGAGNAVGEVGRGRASLLLCGHMDTVPGNLPVRRSGDEIHGRGAADAKSPLCALLFAGAESADSGVKITFAGVTEEEGDGAGIENLMKRKQDFDYAVFGEPGGANRITVAYRGRVALQVKVKTAGGHAASPWANKSALDEFISMLSRLREYEVSNEVQGDHFRSLSITPTTIRAGTYQNVIPGLCEATLDVRIPPSPDSPKIVDDIVAVAMKSGGGTTIEVKRGELTEPYEVPSTSILLRAFQRAILLRLKTKPGFVRKTSTGDMNSFAHRKSSECVTYGPGSSGTSHTDDEVVQVSDYLSSIEVLKEAIRQVASLDRVANSGHRLANQ